MNAALYERRQSAENCRESAVTDHRYRVNGICEMDSRSHLMNVAALYERRQAMEKCRKRRSQSAATSPTVSSNLIQAGGEHPIVQNSRQPDSSNMSTQTLLIIVVLVLLFGGGGFFYSRRGR